MVKGVVIIKRALISVYDKTGVYDFVKELVKMGVEIISTGGTSDYLKKRGIKVTEISEITNFPELMDGRLKTLHPKIHGGLLALRENKDHLSTMEIYDIPEIDLLVVNLYPFENIITKSEDFSEILENIDVGGPAMIRAGAKNFKFVSVLVDLEDYQSFLIELGENSGGSTYLFRRKLAEIAFARTAEYDCVIAQWMARNLENKMPRRLIISGNNKKALRYGENPHQSASYYQTDQKKDILSAFVSHQGKDLSFNNINDVNASIEVLREFENETRALSIIIKHSNTCGVAIRDNPYKAYLAAFNCDRSAAFGGVIAFNVNIDKKTAKAICQIFTEVVIAPSADLDAISEFSKKPNLRLITINKTYLSQTNDLTFQQISGGILLQDKDIKRVSEKDILTVSLKAPSKKELDDMLFAWKVVKYVKSNAIVLAKNLTTVGIGAGQMSRVDSSKIARIKAEELRGYLSVKDGKSLRAVAASDAFFPFSDGIVELADAGVTAIIQPGGSVKDNEIINAANKAKIAMVFTNTRHFNH